MREESPPAVHFNFKLSVLKKNTTKMSHYTGVWWKDSVY